MCALIFRHDGITGSELSERLRVTRSTTSRVIAKLRAKGSSGERRLRGRQAKAAAPVRSSCRQPRSLEYRASMGAALFGSASTPELEAIWSSSRRLEAPLGRRPGLGTGRNLPALGSAPPESLRSAVAFSHPRARANRCMITSMIAVDHSAGVLHPAPTAGRRFDRTSR